MYLSPGILMKLIMVRFIWLVICGIILMETYAQQLTGELKNQAEQKSLMLQDIASCVNPRKHSFHLVGGYHDILWCIEKRLSHCISKEPLPYSSITNGTRESNSYCGTIWTEEKQSKIGFEKEIFITIIDEHYIHFSMIYFNFSLRLDLLCSQHALVMSSEGKNESEYYCGIRIPWTFVLRRNQIIMKLIIAKYMAYHTMIVHNSFSSHMMHKMSTLKKIVYKIPFRIFNLLDVKIRRYNYYIITSLNKKLTIRRPKIPISDVFVRVHDGPGTRSKVIRGLTTADQKIVLNSTSFSVFLTIELNELRTNKSISFDIVSSDLNSAQECSNFRFIKGSDGSWMYEFKSNSQRNVFCSVEYEHVDLYPNILVEPFTFSGPNMMTHLSRHYCQYGGLEIRVNKGEKHFHFCEDVHYISLYSEVGWIRCTFAWFFGYSQGRIVFKIRYQKFSTVYGELLPTRDEVNSDVVMTLKKSTGLTLFICPPTLIYSQARCVIKLGPPSLGPTTVEVLWMNHFKPQATSDTCHNITLDMEYVHSYEWPLVFRNSVLKKRYSLNRRFSIHIFYLHNLTTYLPVVNYCLSDAYRMTFSVQIAGCVMLKDRKDKEVSYQSNGIVVLSGCTTTPGLFAPNNMHIRNHRAFDTATKYIYKEFIYKDNGYASETGHVIDVKYNNCPDECRHYKFTVFVRSADGKRVLQYTADVSKNKIVAHQHRGFRVTVYLVSDNIKCHHYSSNCRLYLGREMAAGSDHQEMSALRFLNRR